jgi:hypothetical protein
VGNIELALENRVEERFGVLPNFFRLGPETPEITEKLWGFAQAAYLDNPLRARARRAFQRRVRRSRFCSSKTGLQVAPSDSAGPR